MSKSTPLVQLAERRFPKPNVEGSSPSRRVFSVSLFLLSLPLGKIFTSSYNDFSFLLMPISIFYGFVEYIHFYFVKKKLVMAKKVIGLVKLALNAGKATPAPPVGPALGQYGANIVMFCKEYNARTGNSLGLVVPAEITIYDDRSFSFILKTPPASVLLAKAAGIKKGSGAPNSVLVGKISQEQLKDIATTKLPDLNTNNLLKAMQIVQGTANNMGIQVDK